MKQRFNGIFISIYMQKQDRRNCLLLVYVRINSNDVEMVPTSTLQAAKGRQKSGQSIRVDQPGTKLCSVQSDRLGGLNPVKQLLGLTFPSLQRLMLPSRWRIIWKSLRVWHTHKHTHLLRSHALAVIGLQPNKESPISILTSFTVLRSTPCR